MKRIHRDGDSVKLQLAWDIASAAHKGQFRRDGITPYMEHVSDVARRCTKLSLNEELTAILHDVLEDSSFTRADIRKMGVSRRVVEAVVAISKAGEDYDTYLSRVKDDPIARAVKIQDMLSNLSDDPTLRQMRRYAKGLLFLTE